MRFANYISLYKKSALSSDFNTTIALLRILAKMWPYWIMFLIPAILATQESRKLLHSHGRPVALAVPSGWLMMSVVFWVLIGLRYEVGGDWTNYLRNFKAVSRLDFGRVLFLDDPGYHLLEWFTHRAGWGIYGVNLLGAAIFVGGLFRFCKFLPRPWLALVAAVPYVIIVMGMGYTRQGIALGFVMVGLVAFSEGRVLRFVIWIVIGATFHKTAVLMLPFAALATSERRAFTALWVVALTASAYFLLLADSVDILRRTYLDAKYESQGALIRLLMNGVPAVLFLTLRKDFEQILPGAQMWFWFSITSLVLLIILFISPSSTAVDRIALYLLPLQLVIFSSLPNAQRSHHRHAVVVTLIIIYYAAVQLTWLNYAANSYAWIPYRWYPLS